MAKHEVDIVSRLLKGHVIINNSTFIYKGEIDFTSNDKIKFTIFNIELDSYKVSCTVCSTNLTKAIEKAYNCYLKDLEEWK